MWGLSGARIKTRKRNIQVPLDPSTYSDAIVHIYAERGGDLVSLRPPALHIPLVLHRQILSAVPLQQVSYNPRIISSL